MAAALAGACLALTYSVFQRVLAVEARIHRINAKLDALLAEAGIDFDPLADVGADVREALERGDKIAAIKLYREATGESLKDAKAYVETLIP